MFFEIRIYQIPNEYFEKKWDIAEADLVSDIRIKDIKGIDYLEEKINLYVEDLSMLKPEWYCDNPI